MMTLVAVDWFKDVKRMDHVARRKGCAVQVCYRTNPLSSILLFYKEVRLFAYYFEIILISFSWLMLI